MRNKTTLGFLIERRLSEWKSLISWRKIFRDCNLTALFLFFHNFSVLHLAIFSRTVHKLQIYVKKGHQK